MRLEGVSTFDSGNWTLRLFFQTETEMAMTSSQIYLHTYERRIRENGTASKWVEAKFEVVVNQLPSLTTEADLPILADVSFQTFLLFWIENIRHL